MSTVKSFVHSSNFENQYEMETEASEHQGVGRLPKTSRTLGS